MTRIRLLNDGYYGDMENVKFPVEVEAVKNVGGWGFDVKASELYRVGANENTFDRNHDWVFEVGAECEVVE